MCGMFIVGVLGAMLAAKLTFHGLRWRHAHACGARSTGRCAAYGDPHGAWAPDDGPEDGPPGAGEGRYRRGRGGFGHGRGGFGRGREGFGRGGFGRGTAERWMLRWLSERLDATPGQEKVIAASLDVMSKAMRDARASLVDSRATIADAVRGEEFGHEKIGEAWVSHDHAFEKVRLELVTELQKLHEALDEEQRKILADLVAKGAFGR